MCHMQGSIIIDTLFIIDGCIAQKRPIGSFPTKSPPTDLSFCSDTMPETEHTTIWVKLNKIGILNILHLSI